ncbi:MAG: cupin domain-containing protein [Hyphomicrobium sp.]|nr:cupin domain-containing protein [Hyphomicrobium sp.]
MNKNADLKVRAAVHAAQLPWQASPLPGVERRILDRIGGEVARATSIVRYEAGSSFAPHVHTGGEEFFVLEGTFQDEHGDFPAGSYVRNPPSTSHTPRSDAGCTIFVKLWQYDMEDRTHVRVDTSKMAFVPDCERKGVEIMPLFNDGREDVRLETWRPNAKVEFSPVFGAEILVLEGSFVEQNERFARLSWLRVPPGGTVSATAGPRGAKLWVKLDHLHAAVPKEIANAS